VGATCHNCTLIALYVSSCLALRSAEASGWQILLNTKPCLINLAHHGKMRQCQPVAFNRQGSHSPGKLLEFYVRHGIFGMVSRFTLILTL